MTAADTGATPILPEHAMSMSTCASAELAQKV
jgi:hypothetical protein